MPGTPERGVQALRWIALATYLALLAAVIVWEAWAAPATPLPRAFWLGVKLLPLALPLPWLARGSARAHVVAALLLLLYFCEGVVAAYRGAHTGGGELGHAATQIALTVGFIAAASVYARLSFRADPPRAVAGTES